MNFIPISYNERHHLSPRSKQNKIYRAFTPARISLVVMALLFYLHQSSPYFESTSSNTTSPTLSRGDCNALTELSHNEISKLESLNLNGCNIAKIPEAIQHATNLSFLDVSNNPKLTTLPQELSSCTKLDILFVSSCEGIKSLPSVLGQMESITRLGWRSGSLTSIDPNGLPPNLIHLILTDNDIEKIDNAQVFAKLQHVKKLMLSHNQISQFGDNEGSISKLQNLELLRIAGNQLTSIPEELWNLPKLTWITISGNPFMDEVKSSIKIKVPWIGIEELKPTGKFLGEGASGKVNSYLWKDDEKVAVKIIHGVTSDGRAEDELDIYGAVGRDGLDHRVVGCVALLRGDKKGAVMQQLPDSLEDLALPPTIVEVTQDRWSNWDNGTYFDPGFVTHVLTDVADALLFLHNDVGVAHGDVYAHNMKVDRETGRVYLLDFGASYFTNNYKYREMAEKIEMRAFGVLIKDLLTRLDPKINMQYRNMLQLFERECQNEDVRLRPTFAEISQAIKMIEKYH